MNTALGPDEFTCLFTSTVILSKPVYDSVSEELKQWMRSKGVDGENEQEVGSQHEGCRAVTSCNKLVT